jgi:hypothetical protein
MPEDTAFRRARAAKWVREFPILLDAIASGELHLTGLLLLGPHLTEQNQREVLARAKHRTKREITRLVRMLDPLPDVPSCVEPLGPMLRAAPRNPSWEEAMLALCPVRELLHGDRPKDWVFENGERFESGPLLKGSPNGAVSNTEASNTGGSTFGATVPEQEPFIQQRYKIQFTATDEYVGLLEQATALLSHAIPNARSRPSISAPFARWCVSSRKPSTP